MDNQGDDREPQRLHGFEAIGELCQREALPPGGGGSGGTRHGEVRPLGDGLPERRVLVEMVGGVSGEGVTGASPPGTQGEDPNKKNPRTDDEEAKPMNQDIPQEAIEELKNLATQMALIKSKYGIHEA